ncbi:MAG: hypothetical protein ABI837_12085, partial [Acidobacteriota bacterium]
NAQSGKNFMGLRRGCKSDITHEENLPRSRNSGRPPGPFERSDYPAGTSGLRIKRPNNIHTSGGLRYRF